MLCPRNPEHGHMYAPGGSGPRCGPCSSKAGTKGGSAKKHCSRCRRPGHIARKCPGRHLAEVLDVDRILEESTLSLDAAILHRAPCVQILTTNVFAPPPDEPKVTEAMLAGYDAVSGGVIAPPAMVEHARPPEPDTTSTTEFLAADHPLPDLRKIAQRILDEDLPADEMTDSLMLSCFLHGMLVADLERDRRADDEAEDRADDDYLGCVSAARSIAAVRKIANLDHLRWSHLVRFVEERL